MAAYAALSAPQLQFSAGPARFFFQAHPNSLKLLDEFRFRQAGVSERRTFSFYLNRASLVEHILRERDLFECNLVPPPQALWDLNCDNFQNVRKCPSHSSASFPVLVLLCSDHGSRVRAGIVRYSRLSDCPLTSFRSA